MKFNTQSIQIKAIVLMLALPLLFSCSKNEGCNDISAINYDQEADFDDDSCVYSKVTFYADSSRFAGTPINLIEIEIDNVVIGSFAMVSKYPPTICENTGTTSYDFTKSGDKHWTAIIYLSNGSTTTNSGTISHVSSQDCILISALP